MARLLDIASTELGVREIAGPLHNERILQYAHEAGFDWVSDDETPWCSIFLNWVCLKAGFERTHDARSQSWQHVGKAVQAPRPGDIVLFSNDGQRIYHVGIFTGFNSVGNGVFCLGGNQSNEVNVSTFPATQVHSFRRIAKDPSAFRDLAATQAEKLPPTEAQAASSTVAPVAPPASTVVEASVPGSNLRFGDTGAQVVVLQEALNALGLLDMQPPNGLYSSATARAIREFQLQNGLKSHGRLNRKTRKLMEELLAQK